MRQGGVSRMLSVTLEEAKQEAEQRARSEAPSGGATTRVLPVMS